MYVYLKSESNLWTVGFHRPDGKWEPESDHDSALLAAARVSALNGGAGALDLHNRLRRLEGITVASVGIDGPTTLEALGRIQEERKSSANQEVTTPDRQI